LSWRIFQFSLARSDTASSSRPTRVRPFNSLLRDQISCFCERSIWLQSLSILSCEIRRRSNAKRRRLPQAFNSLLRDQQSLPREHRRRKPPFNSLLRDQKLTLLTIESTALYFFQFSLARSAKLYRIYRIQKTLILSILSCEISSGISSATNPSSSLSILSCEISRRTQRCC